MVPSQLDLPFDAPGLGDLSLWTPLELWKRLDQELMGQFAEDRRLDFKRADKVDFDDLAKYYSAFSNTPEGGVVVLGATSKGLATGCLALPASQLNRVEDFHLQRCPMARPEFRRIPVSVNGRTDFCVAIYVPYQNRLVETNKADGWARYGDSIHKMSDDEKRDFRSTRGELAFELDCVHSYKFPDDFDEDIVSDFVDEFRRRHSKEDWSDADVLVDRHLATRMDGKLVPHVNLVLLAAKSPRRLVPACRVRVQRFQSEKEGSGNTYQPVKDVWVEGNIVTMIREGRRVIRDMIYNVTWLNRDGVFVTTPEYPEHAWLEALVNACVHRSYSYSGTEVTVKFFPDRLEIESPGGFVPPVNEKTIYAARAARNNHLMDALRYLGYVQMAREGTRRIRESMVQWNLPAPSFAQEAVHGVIVRVVLQNDSETRKRSTTSQAVAEYYGPEVWKALQEYELKILSHVFDNRKIQVSEAQRLTGRQWSTCKKDLTKLVERGFLKYMPGKYERDPKAVYVLDEVKAKVRLE
jgi:ATP-dependent DNA helicase RecG